MITVSIQDKYNPAKVVEFKQSKCGHFYQRQLIQGKAITNWQRGKKVDIKATMKRFSNSKLIG